MIVETSSRSTGKAGRISNVVCPNCKDSLDVHSDSMGAVPADALAEIAGEALDRG